MAVVLTNSGHSGFVTRIIGSGTQPSYLAWGTGAGTTVVGDNTISGEVNSRVVATAAAFTSAITNDTYQCIGVMSATAAYGITNAGLFDASTNGSCFIKGDFSVINLASGDSISFTIRAQLV